VSSSDGWTISMACEDAADAGLPVDPRRFRIIVRNLPGLTPIGELRAPPGSKGGRREALYEVRDMQDLVTALARWLKAKDQG
jgi:hypothetical protein